MDVATNIRSSYPRLIKDYITVSSDGINKLPKRNVFRYKKVLVLLEKVKVKT